MRLPTKEEAERKNERRGKEERQVVRWTSEVCGEEEEERRRRSSEMTNTRSGPKADSDPRRAR